MAVNNRQRHWVNGPAMPWRIGLFLSGVAVGFLALGGIGQDALAGGKPPLKGNAKTRDGFRQALPGYGFHFPADHAAHPDFKTEWWYYTGHLDGGSGKKYGYELTFFRASVDPNEIDPQGQGKQAATNTEWSVTTVFPAHFALTDESGKTFHFWEKMNRKGLDIAGARTDTYSVWNEDWSADLLGKTHVLSASSDKASLKLVLTPSKQPVIHGINGVSQKSNCAGCASHYYSMTRMVTEGTLILDGKAIAVRGTSWMDHEFGSNQLAESQVGWDWFSIQLDNQEEVMLYVLRREGGKPDLASSGTWISPKGIGNHINVNQFTIQPSGFWVSPHSKAKYPAGWVIDIPAQQAHFTLTPTVSDQELRTTASTGVTYWEGSVQVAGNAHGKPVSGQGYVELTGYAQAFRKKI